MTEEVGTITFSRAKFKVWKLLDGASYNKNKSRLVMSYSLNHLEGNGIILKPETPRY